MTKCVTRFWIPHLESNLFPICISMDDELPRKLCKRVLYHWCTAVQLVTSCRLAGRPAKKITQSH